jgi:hypothetical protein
LLTDDARLPGVTSPLRTGGAAFARSATVLAVATAVFLLAVHGQGDGLCNPERTAFDAFVVALMVAIVGLLGVLAYGLLRRGHRWAVLLGWAAGLAPAVTLLVAAGQYVASVEPGCPAGLFTG